MAEEGRPPVKKTRIDRKHRFTYRVDKKLWDRLEGIGFNHSLSVNELLDVLIVAALDNEEIMSSFRLAYPLRKQYVLVREDY